MTLAKRLWYRVCRCFSLYNEHARPYGDGGTYVIGMRTRRNTNDILSRLRTAQLRRLYSLTAVALSSGQNRSDRVRQHPAEMKARICVGSSHQPVIRGYDKCRGVDRCMITRHMLDGKRSRYILCFPFTNDSSALRI